MKNVNSQLNSPKLACSRCQHTYLHKFGHDRDGDQKYRCVSCGYQFVPGKSTGQSRQQRPQMTCTLCGRRMYPFKTFKTYIRYRCSGYRRTDESKCTFKLNLYLTPDNERVQSQSFWASDWGQKFLSLKPFSWSKMSFSKETVGLVLYLALIRALPAPEVVETMHDLYQIVISHDTVTRWTHKASSLLARNFKDYRFNLANQSLHTDETAIKAGPKRINQQRTKLTNKVWVWQSKAKQSKVVTGLSFSLRRNSPSAREHLQTVKDSSVNEPEQFIQDSLWSYGAAFPEVYPNPETIKKRQTYQDFTDKINNNIIERQHGYLKSYCRRHRGFKSYLGLVAFTVARTIIWNFFKGRVEFNGLTPAEMAGVRLPKNKTKLIHWL